MEVGGRGRLYTYRYTVTTKMTSALRWAAMRALSWRFCLRYYTGGDRDPRERDEGLDPVADCDCQMIRH